jgi:hypothetical protein
MTASISSLLAKLSALRTTSSALALALVLASLIHTSSIYAASRPLSLGHIDFPTSATGEAQQEFTNGVLALHSMWYEKARVYFRHAQQLDPAFGMAYWGEAMSYDNAFLVEPDVEEEEKAGTEVVQRMEALDAQGALRWNEREKGFAKAIRARFKPATSVEERREAYASAMSQMAERYPNDDEVTVFTALAIMALPKFDNTDPSNLVPVAGRLEQVYEHNRKHPGALLLLIQLYSTPAFALMGLRQARVYAAIVPPSVHAIHMPSHIFRLLGMWPEVEASNVDCWNVAVELQQQTRQPFRQRDLHCLDWLGDAIVNLNHQDQARKLLASLDALSAQHKGKDWDTFRQFVAALHRDFGQKFPALAK